jgi:tetratricopeptide (TPR) repeat protein
MASEARAKITNLLAEDKIAEADALASSNLSKAISSGDQKSLLQAQLGLADVALAKFEVEMALKVTREAWTLSKQLKDDAAQAEAIILMVNGLLLKGSAKEAVKAINSFMSIVRSCGKPALEASINHSLASAYLKLGDAEKALDAENKAKELHEKSGDKRGQAVSMVTIAKAQNMLGNFNEAITTAKEACTAWRALGKVVGIVAAVDRIVDAQAALGFPQASLAAAEEELSLLQKAGGDKTNNIILMERIAQIASDCGEKVQAVNTIEAIIKVYQDAGDKSGEAKQTLNMAEMHLTFGHLQDAIRTAKEAEELFNALEQKGAAEEARKIQTSVCVKQKQHTKAPHRSEALLALKNFIRAIENRDVSEVKKIEGSLDKAAGAIQDAEMTAALDSVFERDPNAIQFLENQGWDLESFKTPTLMFQVPHKSFYLQMCAGGMGFGPQFRSAHPWKKGLKIEGVQKTRTLGANWLPETEDWQGRIMYRHGIMDSAFQSSGIMNNDP